MPMKTRRAAAARTERPLLLVGLGLVAAHLLDLAFAGPDTTLLAVVAIVAATALWAVAQTRVMRATRAALAIPFGLVFLGFGVISHGFHTALYGPAWTDVTGLGFATGGALMIASGFAALAAPSGGWPRWWRVPLWLVGAAVVMHVAFAPVLAAVKVTHAPRLPLAGDPVKIDGLTAAYVPSRNGATILLVHGSGGSRGRVKARAEMLARHGYGVLALDLPGNGGSAGRNNGLGENAQPAVRKALDYLEARGADRIGGFGVSLGAEVLLEAAAHDRRLETVIADGATRPRDGGKLNPVGWLALQAVRGISGMRSAPSLTPLMSRIQRPVLLIAGSGFPKEIPANRRYRAAGGPLTQLLEFPDTDHTAGLRTHPKTYEARTIAFLDATVRPR